MVVPVFMARDRHSPHMRVWDNGQVLFLVSSPSPRHPRMSKRRPHQSAVRRKSALTFHDTAPRNQLAPHLCRLVAQLPDAPSLNVDQEVTDHGALASVEELRVTQPL